MFKKLKDKKFIKNYTPKKLHEMGREKAKSILAFKNHCGGLYAVKLPSGKVGCGNCKAILDPEKLKDLDKEDTLNRIFDSEYRRKKYPNAKTVDLSTRVSIGGLIKEYEKKKYTKKYGKLISWHHLRNKATGETIFIPIWENYDPLRRENE